MCKIYCNLIGKIHCKVFVTTCIPTMGTAIHTKVTFLKMYAVEFDPNRTVFLFYNVYCCTVLTILKQKI